jgi:hypothetical protein
MVCKLLFVAIFAAMLMALFPIAMLQRVDEGSGIPWYPFVYLEYVDWCFRGLSALLPASHRCIFTRNVRIDLLSVLR